MNFWNDVWSNLVDKLKTEWRFVVFMLCIGFSILLVIFLKPKEPEPVYYEPRRDLTFKLGDMVSPKIFPERLCAVAKQLEPDNEYDWRIDCNRNGKVTHTEIYDHELQVYTSKPQKHIFEIGDSVKLKITPKVNCIVVDHIGDMRSQIECDYGEKRKFYEVFEKELFNGDNFWEK